MFSLIFFFFHRPPGASCNIFSLAEVSLGEMDRNFGMFIETRSPSTFNRLFSNIMRTNYRKGDIMKTQVVRSCGMKTKAHKGSRPWTAGSRINTLRWQTWKLICVMFLIPPSNLMCTFLLIEVFWGVFWYFRQTEWKWSRLSTFMTLNFTSSGSAHTQISSLQL